MKQLPLVKKLKTKKIMTINKDPKFPNREEKIITEAFCKLFNQDTEKIIKLKLFEKPNFYLARIFESLSKIPSEQFVTVLVFMEFLLNSKESAKELIEDLHKLDK